MKKYTQKHPKKQKKTHTEKKVLFSHCTNIISDDRNLDSDNMTIIDVLENKSNNNNNDITHKINDYLNQFEFAMQNQFIKLNDIGSDTTNNVIQTLHADHTYHLCAINVMFCGYFILGCLFYFGAVLFRLLCLYSKKGIK